MRINFTTMLQPTKYRHFTSRSSASVFLTGPSKIIFIHLHFSTKGFLRCCLSMLSYRSSKSLKVVSCCLAINSNQWRYTSCCCPSTKCAINFFCLALLIRLSFISSFITLFCDLGYPLNIKKISNYSIKLLK